MLALDEPQKAAAEIQAAQPPGTTPDNTLALLLALALTLTGQTEEARSLYHELTKRLEAAHEPWESFTAALELPAKETALLDAIGAAVAAESEAQMPKSFRQNYTKDKTDPGYRTWTRTGSAWEEKHPSGKIKRFQTASRAWVAE